ncbi:TrmH family RNA methyltransferase [Longimicrobium sp.]
MSPETRARADMVVGIPLRGRAESLNVAAAGAILLYELLR